MAARGNSLSPLAAKPAYTTSHLSGKPLAELALSSMRRAQIGGVEVRKPPVYKLISICIFFVVVKPSLQHYQEPEISPEAENTITMQEGENPSPLPVYRWFYNRRLMGGGEGAKCGKHPAIQYNKYSTPYLQHSSPLFFPLRILGDDGMPAARNPADGGVEAAASAAVDDSRVSVGISSKALAKSRLWANGSVPDPAALRRASIHQRHQLAGAASMGRAGRLHPVGQPVVFSSDSY